MSAAAPRSRRAAWLLAVAMAAARWPQVVRVWVIMRALAPGGAALGDHQRADRLDRAVPALDAPRARPDLGGAGSADGVERVGLALAAAVLPVGPAGLHDPDTSRGDVAGQAGAVAAGTFDPGQAHGPEPAQPAQQAAGSGRGGRELLDL